MMRRYPAYRDLGVEWLGEVPDGWEVRRLKEVCRVFPSNVDKHTVEGETPVLLCNYTDVYYREVITRDLDFMRASATDEQIQKFHLKEGDVLFTKDSETADDIGISALVKETMVDVLCGYHLSIARPKPGTSGGFIKRFLDSASAKAHFAVTANGLTRVGLGQAAVGNLALPFPPLAQQTAIAAFLDRETAKLDALVDEQRRLIALLREKRQAVISHTVTKGLNPAAPMKPSGVDWLGDVPEGWEIRSVSSLFELGRGRVISHEYMAENPGEFPVYSSQTERNGVMGSIGTFDFEGNYLTWTTDGANAGTVFHRSGRFNCTNVCGTLKPKEEINLEYMRFALLGATGYYVRHDINPKLMNGVMAKIRVPLPTLSEQTRIARYIHDKTGHFAAVLATAEAAIALLQERRAALISAAVTGKIDVRDLAPARTEAA